MDLLAVAVTGGIFVGLGYLSLRSYWIEDSGLNSELFQ
jgi:hypothetical protein